MSGEEQQKVKNITSAAKSPVKLDKELEEFRSLMEPPSTFEDGFTWPAFFGALFVAFLMVPGGIYMGLVAGTDPSGGAARWVTVILFIEVARRANKVLKRAEIFVLFYLVGAAMSMPFSGILWNQFFVQSAAARANGITELIPNWFAPVDPDVLALRTVFDARWLPAILMVIFFTIVNGFDNTILGYGLFKLTSDIERLPFPMAPLGAQGILALSEEQEEEKHRQHDLNRDTEKPSSWRWRVFAIGGAIGLVFGLVYVGLPVISGAFVNPPMSILPIPFEDWTPKTKGILPAVATGLSFDLGNLLVGMVLPFMAVIGSSVGLVATFIANPIMYHAGILKSWNPGDGTIPTQFKNDIDFYFSFGIGIALAVAVAGIVTVTRTLLAQRRERALHPATVQARRAPQGRGDISNRWIITLYLFSTCFYILLCSWLVDWHRGVMTVLVFYGFVYTPIISYVTARLEGIAGQVVSIPFVKEATFILSGYQGVTIWFLPIPLHNYGPAVVGYRTCELTGTRFWSMWKTQLIFTPIVLVSSLIFVNFIWGLAPIPSAQYPFAQRMWDLNAENQCVMYTATMGGYSMFQKAFVPLYLLIGLALGSAGFGLMSWLGWPTFLIYGIVRGLGQALPHGLVPQLMGALLGQFYFKKKFGKMWRQYIPVIAAGFGCGMGLVSMVCIGITFLAKSVFKLPF